MSHEITESDWREIDAAILANDKFSAFKKIRTSRQCGLKDAIDIFTDRFDLLVANRRAEFVCDLDSYWAGFYS